MRSSVTRNSARAAAIIVVLTALGIIALALERERGALPRAQAAAVGAATATISDVELTAKAAIVADMKSGRAFFEKNADAQLPLASLTKVALVLVVAEALPPETTLTLPHVISAEGGRQLTRDRPWTVQDVVDFTLLTSSNDGARVLAEAAEGAVRTTYQEAPENGAALWRMNELTREIGLPNMRFLNVSGLDESKTLAGAYGSARDTAALFAFAAERYPGIFARTADESARLVGAFARNTNEAIPDIPGLVMGKTGTTDLAGANLAIVFDVGIGHKIVAVVLGSTPDGRYSDMKLLVERTREVISAHR